jgi:hypothetical protein
MHGCSGVGVSGAGASASAGWVSCCVPSTAVGGACTGWAEVGVATACAGCAHCWDTVTSGGGVLRACADSSHCACIADGVLGVGRLAPCAGDCGDGAVHGIPADCGSDVRERNGGGEPVPCCGRDGPARRCRCWTAGWVVFGVASGACTVRALLAVAALDSGAGAGLGLGVMGRVAVGGGAALRACRLASGECGPCCGCSVLVGGVSVEGEREDTFVFEVKTDDRWSLASPALWCACLSTLECARW